MKITVIFILLLTCNLAKAEEVSRLQRKANMTIANFELYSRITERFRSTKDLRDVQYSALQFDITLKNSVDDHATSELNRLSSQSQINRSNDECQRDSNSNYCDSLPELLENYKSRYNSDYKPVTMTYPEVDIDDFTYTMSDGRTYNLKLMRYMDSADQD